MSYSKMSNLHFLLDHPIYLTLLACLELELLMFQTLKDLQMKASTWIVVLFITWLITWLTWMLERSSEVMTNSLLVIFTLYSKALKCNMHTHILNLNIYCLFHPLQKSCPIFLNLQLTTILLLNFLVYFVLWRIYWRARFWCMELLRKDYINCCSNLYLLLISHLIHFCLRVKSINLCQCYH